MTRLIVSVRRPDDPGEIDLEVPAEIEAGRLAWLIAQALGWEHDGVAPVQRYRVEAQPLGRSLRADETLKSAGLSHGAALILTPLVASQDGAASDLHSMAVLARNVHASPLLSRRPLGIRLPDGPTSDPAAAPPGDGYVWKRLDDSGTSEEG